MAEFLEIFEDVTKFGTKIPTNEYLENGLYPIIDQGQNYISGYYNDDTGLFSDVPAIIFGDHTRVLKYIDVPCFLGADGVKLLKVKDKQANCKYFYYALCNAKIPNTGYNRHFKWLKEVIIPVPNLEIQKQIASNLDKITHIIDLCNAILEKLDLLVKSRFVEMFGILGTDVNGWGLQALGKCCKINPKKADDKRLNSSLEVSFIPMSAISENGNMDISEIKKYDEVKTGFTYFAENDVIFAKITPCMENGKGAVAKGLCNGIGFGSTEFHVLRPIDKVSNSYWLYVLTSFESFRKNASENMTGSAGQRRVPTSFLDKYKIALPPIELQEQFADFVKQVDKSKLAVKQVLEKAEILKNALMQEYFG